MNKRRTLAISCALLIFFSFLILIVIIPMLFYRSKRLVSHPFTTQEEVQDKNYFITSRLSEDCSKIYFELDFSPEPQTFEVYYDDKLIERKKVRSGDVVATEFQEDIEEIQAKLIYDEENYGRYTFTSPYCRPESKSEKTVLEEINLTEEQKAIPQDWANYSSKAHGFDFLYPEIWNLKARLKHDSEIISLDYDDPEILQIDLPGPNDDSYDDLDYSIDIRVEQYDKESFESSIEGLDKELKNKDGNMFFIGESGCTPSSGPSYIAYTTDERYIYSISYCSLASENVEKVIDEVYYPLIYNFEY